jgi:hypothetical protein
MQSGTYTLRIFVHIVRSNSGSGLGSGIVSTIVSKLNADYTNTGIQFQSIGSDFIDNNTFYNDLATYEYAALYATNSHTNAIDIYVLGTSTTTYSVAGAAASIPSTALWIHGNYYNKSVLSHEMGHCIGLYHTHHGTVTESGGDTQQCKELVNGSNSSTCGDYVSDTPADPNLWDGCNYTGNANNHDTNNQQYSPNPSNYMAYSDYTCWNLFTSVQKQRMKDFIVNTAILQNVVIITISGPTHFCTDGTFQVNNLPSDAAISAVRTSNSLLTTGVSNTTITVNNSSGISGGAWMVADIDINSSTVTTDTVRFLVGEIIPMSAEIFHSCGASDECNGWCSNQSGNKFRLEFGLSDSRYNALSGDLNYQYRLVRYSNNTVVYTSTDYVSGLTAVDVDYIPYPVYNEWFVLEVKLVNCSGSSWHPLIEVEFVDCSLINFESMSAWSAAYPNPSSNELIIDKTVGNFELSTAIRDENNSPETTVLLYSHATTKLAYTKTYPSSTKQIKIDTSKLPNGVYYLNIVEKGETVKQQTIIVDH